MNAPPGQPPGGYPPGPPPQGYPPAPQDPHGQGYPAAPQGQGYAPAPQGQQPPAPGYPPAQPYGYAAPLPPVQKKNDTLAIVSIALAAGAWVTQMHLMLSLPAVIVGIIALRKIKSDPETYGGDGIAKAGIGVGLANALLSLLGILFVIAYIILAIVNELM